MSAFGGKADVNYGPAEGPLLARSGPKDEWWKSEIFQNRLYGKPPLSPRYCPRFPAVHQGTDDGYGKQFFSVHACQAGIPWVRKTVMLLDS